MNFVGYLTNYPSGLSGDNGLYYDYILAANGLFIEAANAVMSARIPVAVGEVRGLAPTKPGIALKYGSIPQRFFDLALDTFMANPNKEYYVAVTADAGYHFYVPVQDQDVNSVVYELGDSVVLDIHSHGLLKAEFSTHDNDDEKGLKISAVMGELGTTPVVKLRVGVYGYYYRLSWHEVFDGSLIGAIEQEGQEVDEV